MKKETDSRFICKSFKEREETPQMNTIMIDNISDLSMNETKSKYNNYSPMNRYLKSRKDLSRDHDTNLMKLK